MEIKLNLSSKPYLNRQRIRLWLLLSCALMLLLLTFNSYYSLQGWRQIRLLESRSQELDGQVTGIQGVSGVYSPEKYAEIKGEIALENEIVAADQFRWTSLLSRFEELLPDDVSIQSIQPSFSEHSVKLACIALDVSAMTRFVDRLLMSEDLNQAYLQQHGEIETESAAGKQTHVGFSLVIREAF